MTDLRKHEPQLWERYVRPLKADYGVLYNGLELIFYKRVGDEQEDVFTAQADEITEEQVKQLLNLLQKPDYDTTDIDRVLEYFDKFDDPEERLELVEEAAREHFFQNFRLQEQSAFGNLLQNTIQLFDYLQERDNRFLTSAYDFWKRSYAKSPDTVPEDWKPLMEQAGLSEDEDDLYKFMFCLETAYAVFARLILAKSGEDYDFPDVRFSGFIENKVEDASRRGDISPASWAKITQELIADLEENMVSSVFEEDIFYWWTEAYDKDYGELFGERGGTTLEMGKFGDSMARILLMLYKFNFSEIEGDPLGILYQRYFDKETRKALGEFYTPQEVVDYILDAVEYDGVTVTDKRLLDPACGSGTFPVTALQRYLEASEQRAEKEGWDTVLDDLCNKYRIVGFDIHPFATIMAQIQFMLVLLPRYKDAIEDAKEKGEHFVLQRVPIFRTDSLKKETAGGDMTILDWKSGEKISMKIELPVKGEDGEDNFFTDTFDMPTPETARKETDLHNNEEYFGALQALFDVVKGQAHGMQDGNGVPEFDTEEFEYTLKSRYLSDKDWSALSTFFEPFASELLEQIETLQSEFDDGRLVKSIEDIFLAALLKTQDYDYVVGNPPYVRIQNLPDEQKTYLNETYDSSTGNYDLYCPFIERGIEWLPGSGRLGYITPNQFMVTDYGEGIRNVLLNRVRIEELFDFRDSGVFEDVTNYPVILTLEKEGEEQEREDNDIRGIRVRANVDEDSGRELDEEVITRVRDNRSNPGYSDDYIDVYDYPQDALGGGYWPLMPPDEHRVFQKLEDAADKQIEDVTDAVFQGIRTSANTLYVVDVLDADRVESSDTGGKVTVAPIGGSGTFEIEKDLLRPFLQGDEVQRWRGAWSGLHVVHPYFAREDDDGELETGLYPQDELKNDLPLTWEFFKAHKEKLEKRESGRKEGKDDWYGYIYPKNLDKFEHPKIVQGHIAEDATFMIDSAGTWYFTTAYGVLLNQKYRDRTNELTCQLNSNVLDFYFKHITTVKAGGFYEYRSQYVEKLPCIVNDDGDAFDSLRKKLRAITDRIDDKNKIDRFPSAYLSNAEAVPKTVTMDAGHSSVSADVQERQDGGFNVVIGKRKKEDPFVVDTQEKAEFVRMALEGRNVSKDETVEVLVPKSNSVVEEILEEYEEDHDRLEEGATVEELEEEINEVVYDLYGLDEDDVEVIEDFLEKF